MTGSRAAARRKRAAQQSGPRLLWTFRQLLVSRADPSEGGMYDGWPCRPPQRTPLVSRGASPFECCLSSTVAKQRPLRFSSSSQQTKIVASCLVRGPKTDGQAKKIREPVWSGPSE